MRLQPTGVPQLDRVLGGGIAAGDLVLVVGAAGSGKTTMALQMAFGMAARGEVACFVSTTSESPERLLDHARSYGFYDEGAIGDRLLLLSIFPLMHEGMQPVRVALEREVRENGVRLLVLDGLMTLYDLHPEPREVRLFLFELSATLSGLGCTLLVTSSRAGPGPLPDTAEHTMADVLIQVEQPVLSARSHRVLQAVKVRGRSPLLGLHSAKLDERGLAVYPRFESLARSGDVRPPEERVGSGLEELDAMLSGGLPPASVTAVAGAVGTGKTLLCLQFLLDGARRGRTGMMLSLRETEREMVAKARSFGMDLETPIREGRIRFVHHVPVDLTVDELMNELDAALDRDPFERFALDGVSELMRHVQEESRRSALVHVLEGLVRSRGVTSMIAVQVPKWAGPELDVDRTPIAALAHNLALLRYVEHRGELHRILSLLKVRDSDFDPSIRRYVITSDGLRILESTDSPNGLLESIARLPSEARVKRSSEPGDA
jgi:circadian clock protein KaiC